jgi:hypothetical protein
MSFASAFRAEMPPLPGDTEVLEDWSAGAPGILEFMRQYSGCSFLAGLYRVHAITDIPRWTNACVAAFPAFEGRVLCFASDWQGNQFALDSKRVSATGCLVLLFEPGSGEVLKIPSTFAAFHDVELVNDKDAILSVSFYKEWLIAGGARPNSDQCIGYKQPLFLGGKDEISNLELIDMDVYWTIVGQLVAKTFDLEPGSRICGINRVADS